MSDEEKEAIEILKLYFGDNPTLNITKYVNIVLNLIEKQSKEIEELHKEINQRIKLKLENERCADEDFIHKDKIKAKIEEVNAEELNLAFIISGVEYKEAITSALQSLLAKE